MLTVLVQWTLSVTVLTVLNSVTVYNELCVNRAVNSVCYRNNYRVNRAVELCTMNSVCYRVNRAVYNRVNRAVYNVTVLTVLCTMNSVTVLQTNSVLCNNELCYRVPC